MAGIFTHLTIAFVSVLIVLILRFKFMYALAIFTGNLLPDVIKFGFSAIKQSTIHIFAVNQDGFFKALSQITSAYSFWFTIGFFIFAGLLALHHYKYLRKREMEEYAELYLFFLLGIATHLLLDVMILEPVFWL